MRLRSRPRSERVRPRPNDLASSPHGPRGLNIPVKNTQILSRTDVDVEDVLAVWHRLGASASIPVTTVNNCCSTYSINCTIFTRDVKREPENRF